MSSLLQSRRLVSRIICSTANKRLCQTNLFQWDGGAGISTAHHRGLATKVADFRSDTVTLPSREMLEVGMNARLGDDVMGEDPSVLELEETMATMFGKDKALFVPTGTMANLVAILAHCHTRASEIIIGQESHLNLWEGGHVAGMGGIYARQLPEDECTAELDPEQIKDVFRDDSDDHWPETMLLCLENTHNMCGGVALSPNYMNRMAELAHDLGIKCHVDGARIFNSVVAQNVEPKRLCEKIDSIAVCFSKGLGSPLGSVLIGDSEIIRLAKRARKRCGGGMRQAGVVASMGLYAVKNNVSRLAEDHARAKRVGAELKANGLNLLRDGVVDSNIVYFSLPNDTMTPTAELVRRASENYNVRFGGGYSKGGKLFRIVTHLGVDDEDADRCIEAIVNLYKQGS
jgi:threonine aldolase